MLILRPEEVRQLPEKHALIVAENSKPIIARLTRCVEGKSGQELLTQQSEIRRGLQARQGQTISSEARAIAALASGRQADQ
jgi:type IV secretion system protein VirD4